MITFDKDEKLFHLQTPNTSYVLGLLEDKIIAHIYYGKRLTTAQGIATPKNAFMHFCANHRDHNDSVKYLATDVYRQDYSFFGSCDLRKPAFHAQYADGHRITEVEYVSHKIIKGKPALTGLPATYTEDDSEADTLELTMQDKITGLTLILRYTAYNTYDAITRSVSVINDGNNDINLKSVLSFSMDLNRADFDFINLSGAWARERHVERRHLGTGTTKVESRRGSSSHNQSPFFALCDKGANEDYGSVYGFSLLYSGNFEAGAEVDTYGQTRAFMGINSFNFNWKLTPGEEFHAPEAVMVYSENGFGDMSRTFHTLYKKRLARGKHRDLDRPILINNWEATYFNFNEDKIVDIAKTAKKAGIEMLVLDDGWFGKRNNDDCSLGDWYVDKSKLPNGLNSLATKINDLGMKFGLWFEPEMISPDSDLYRAHPDWCLHVGERHRYISRNQLILDLSRKDVCDYILSFLTEILSSAPISYIKWDMNRNMACVGSSDIETDRQPEVYHRYMLGLYDILEKITKAFPDVLFEGCSGGGGRFDAGMMHYFNQYWTSDDTDAIERMYIQYGTSFVMPSAFMAAHVSAVPNHQTMRTTPLKTRGYVAMGGQFGYELDVTKMTDEELLEVKNQIAEYKSVQQIVHNGNLYRTISPFENEKCGWTYVSDDKSAAVQFFFTIHHQTSELSYYVKFKGLDPDATYQVTGKVPTAPELEGQKFSGDVLMNLGLPIFHTMDCDGTMIKIEKI